MKILDEMLQKMKFAKMKAFSKNSRDVFNDVDPQRASPLPYNSGKSQRGFFDPTQNSSANRSLVMNQSHNSNFYTGAGILRSQNQPNTSVISQSKWPKPSERDHSVYINKNYKIGSKRPSGSNTFKSRDGAYPPRDSF